MRRDVLLALATQSLLFMTSCGAGDQPPVTDPSASAPPGPTAVTRSDLLSLAKRWAPSPLTVTFAFSSTAAGSTDEGTVVLRRASPTSWRVDLETGGSVSILIRRQQTWFVCTGQGGAGTCSQSQTPERVPAPIPAPFMEYLTDPPSLPEAIGRRVPDGPLEGREEAIAAQPATCYAAPDEEGAWEWCLGADGTLLRVRAPGSFLLGAIRVAQSVSAGDLRPPYPATEIRP